MARVALDRAGRPCRWRTVWPRCLHPARAHRAAALLLSGAGVDGGLPDVPLRTEPPHLLAAAGGDHLGVRLPLRVGCHWAATLGAALVKSLKPGSALRRRSRGTRCRAWSGPPPPPIGVAFLTDPPHLPVAAGGYGVRRPGSVSIRVPLGRDAREQGLQVVLAGLDRPAGADRTARCVYRPGKDGRLPFVPAVTAPPDLPVGARRHRPGGQGGVFDGVPLPCQMGVGGRQIVVPRLNRSIGADRTAAAGRPGFDDGLPFMPLLADPPNSPVAAGRHLLRGQGSVLGGMPLFQQPGPVSPPAKLG